MPGRLHQARTRAEGVMKRRMDRLAQLVADGVPVHHAGQACLGLTKGETANVWRRIKQDLGAQAV